MDSYPYASPQSASSSTLITHWQPGLKPSEFEKLQDDLQTVLHPRPHPRPQSLPPTRMSANGFIEPHHSHLPRRPTRTGPKRGSGDVRRVPAALNLDNVDSPTTEVAAWVDSPAAGSQVAKDSAALPSSTSKSTLVSAGTNATELPTSNDGADEDNRPNGNPNSSLPPSTPPQQEQQQRFPNSLPFHTRHDRDRSLDHNFDISVDSPEIGLLSLAAKSQHPQHVQTPNSAKTPSHPHRNHHHSPSPGPTKSTLPRRKTTARIRAAEREKNERAELEKDEERGREREKRRHVRRYILDGVDRDDVGEQDKESQRRELEGEGEDVHVDIDDSGPHRPVNKAQPDDRCLQLLKAGGKEVVLGFVGPTPQGSSTSTGECDLGFDISQPVVLIEGSSSSSSSSSLSLSLPATLQPSDIQEGICAFTPEQWKEAFRFMMDNASSPTPITIWAPQRGRREEALGIASVYLSWWQRRCEDSFPSSPTPPPTSSASSSLSSSSSISPTPTQPTPDVTDNDNDNTYSPTHLLMFKWADEGSWLGRVGFCLSHLDSDSALYTQSQLGDGKSGAELQTLRNQVGLKDSWRGVFSWEGLDALEEVVSANSNGYDTLSQSS